MLKYLRTSNLKVKTIAASIVILLNLSIFIQPAAAADAKLTPAATKGLDLFKANCDNCHDMMVKEVGPALQGVTGRHSEEWLLKWIKNNDKLRASGDKEAIAVYNENGKTAMNTFEHLSDDQIKSVITYFKEWTPPAKTANTAGGGDDGKVKFYSESTLYILLFFIVILCIVLIILRRTRNNLKQSVKDIEIQRSTEAHEPGEWQKKMAYYKKRINPTIFKLTVGVIIILSLASYGFIFGVTEVGVQQGYKPEQPIKYSHRLHAGELKIDCKYCHSTVEKSKNATIPGLNTCMNCHKGVQLREKYNGEISPEIKKIYAALDYDADAQKYGTNPRPIRWVRVHNLPDHAVFHHSQHVKGAGLQCQECHGPIQQMEVVEQYATLQMGWCVNCHRERNIDVENNPYYEELHAKIKAEKNNKNSPYSKYFVNGKINITAAQNGALECSKCHY